MLGFNGCTTFSEYIQYQVKDTSDGIILNIKNPMIQHFNMHSYSNYIYKVDSSTVYVGIKVQYYPGRKIPNLNIKTASKIDCVILSDGVNGGVTRRNTNGEWANQVEYLPIVKNPCLASQFVTITIYLIITIISIIILLRLKRQLTKYTISNQQLKIIRLITRSFALLVVFIFMLYYNIITVVSFKSVFKFVFLITITIVTIVLIFKNYKRDVKQISILPDIKLPKKSYALYGITSIIWGLLSYCLYFFKT